MTPIEALKQIAEYKPGQNNGGPLDLAILRGYAREALAQADQDCLTKPDPADTDWDEVPETKGETATPPEQGRIISRKEIQERLNELVAHRTIRAQLPDVKVIE